MRGVVKESLDLTAVLILQAPRGKRYDGKQAWDALQCLGLRWGDMDCFHWPNESDVGDDSFFSVETSTSPGYFLPEEVAAGRVRVEDLVFNFSVPRCARPVEVFDAMGRAVEYCRSRLGGTVVDADQNPANLAALRQQIVSVCDGLAAAGFKPGLSATLQVF
jgi:cell division protein ZipA